MHWHYSYYSDEDDSWTAFSHDKAFRVIRTWKIRVNKDGEFCISLQNSGGGESVQMKVWTLKEAKEWCEKREKELTLN